MVGGMTPPLVIALSATINKNILPKAQRSGAISNPLMYIVSLVVGTVLGTILLTVFLGIGNKNSK